MDGNRGRQKGKMKQGDDEEIVELLKNKNNEEEQRVESVLVSKLWTDNSFNISAFMSTIKRVWNARKGVEFNELGKNLFLFHFHLRNIGYVF